MVRVRRRQTRRSLAGDAGFGIDAVVLGVVDAIEKGTQDEGVDGVAVGEVARRLGVDQSQASRLVARAVDAGLVERIASQRDGRRVLVTLTEAGDAASLSVHQQRQTTFRQATRGWTNEERTQLATLLTRFIDALDEQGSTRRGRQDGEGPGDAETVGEHSEAGAPR